MNNKSNHKKGGCGAMGKLKRILALILGSALMVTGAVGCGQGEVAKKQEKFDTFVAGFGNFGVVGYDNNRFTLLVKLFENTYYFRRGMGI